MRFNVFCLIAAAAAAPAALTIAAPTAAQQYMPPGVTATLPETTLLTINAEGKARLKPDIAMITAGVVTQAATANEALSQNRTRMERVVAALRSADVERADIQTSNLNLRPEYQYEENKQPVITGYRADNQVRVTIRDLDDAGAVLDALVAVGANQFSGPDFQIDDQDAALDAARRDAIEKARSRAQLYAGAAGMNVGRIVSIVENGGGNMPPPMPVSMMRQEAADASSPVEPGRLSLTSNVTVVFELR